MADREQVALLLRSVEDWNAWRANNTTLRPDLRAANLKGAKLAGAIGHSNGTYLPARALQLYPSCRFHRLAFAGSVLQSKFPWVDHVPPRRNAVESNFVATKDWVVAGFPSIFEFFPLTDLGGASNLGFRYEIPGVITNYRFAAGAHAAALAEKFWNSLGDFIINGTPIPLTLRAIYTTPAMRCTSALSVTELSLDASRGTL